MHAFAIKENGEGRWARRYFLTLDLPTNPICWLFGHRAKVTIVEPRYSDPWRLVRCRVCDLRYTDPNGGKSLWFMAEDRETRRLLMDAEAEAGKRLSAGQLEVARRDPKQVEESCSGREGYGNRKLELKASVYAYKPTRHRMSAFGFRLHTGGRGSETPLDAHFDLGVVALYLEIGGIGGRWCEWIGRGHGRDISLKVHGGQLWWKLWYDGNCGNDEHHRCDSWRKPLLPPWRWGRRKHRPWMCLRDGNIALNPLDAWFGSPKYHHDDLDEPRRALVTVGEFPGDEYPVDFTVQRQERRRDHGPRWARRLLSGGYTFSAEAHPGIPVRNHEWKGDEILGWGGSLDGWTPDSGADWLPLAVASTVATVKRDRKHHDYRPPREPAQQGQSDA